MTSTRPDAVEAVLDDFFDDSRARAAVLGERFVELWGVLERSVTSAEPRRAHLVATTYEALGGTDRLACAGVGAALELLHAAFAIHGDVIGRGFADDDTVSSTCGVRQIYRDDAVATGIPADRADLRGMTAAIVAGDLALTGASRILLALDSDSTTKSRLLDLIDEAVFVSAGAQLSAVDRDPTDAASVAAALEAECARDATLSFATPLQAGAILAGASGPEVETLGSLGRRLGTPAAVAGR